MRIPGVAVVPPNTTGWSPDEAWIRMGALARPATRTANGAYVPLPTTTVSPATLALTAAWIECSGATIVPAALSEPIDDDTYHVLAPVSADFVLISSDWTDTTGRLAVDVVSDT